MNKIVIAILLVNSLFAVGCVRPSGRDPSPTPKNVAAATRKAWSDHSNRMADVFKQLADSPPKTVTEAAAFTVKADEDSRKQFRREIAEVMQPVIDNGKDDALDPAAAKKLFSEMAKGLRK